MIETIEQGLERLEKDWWWTPWQKPAVDALISALRQARADLQEARALLMTAMDLAKEGANLVREPKPAPKPWSREAEFKGRVGYNGEDCRAFLARTAPRAGGET